MVAMFSIDEDLRQRDMEKADFYGNDGVNIFTLKFLLLKRLYFNLKNQPAQSSLHLSQL